MAPAFIVGYAKLAGVQVLSITDHNEIRGTLSGAKIANKLGLIFFPGIEMTFAVKGKAYELLAYFYDVDDLRKFYKEYRFHNGFLPTFRSVNEAIELIRQHNGTEIVPHPFGRKGIFRRLRHRGIDVRAIEVINAFTGQKRNIKARRHQEKDNNFLKLAAADMHFFVGDIHRVYTELSSRKEITKDTVWKSLKRKSDIVTFKAIGHQFSQFKIWFQKPLCGVVYFLNYPRLYLSYKFDKWRYKKLS